MERGGGPIGVALSADNIVIDDQGNVTGVFGGNY